MNRSPIVLLVLAATLCQVRTATADVGQLIGNQGQLCARAIAREESRRGVPAQLLAAMSLVESGRRDPRTGELIAWPWTVTAEGRGRFYRGKSEAVAAVRRLRARGIRNIDVGCLQVNLLHHPDAFASLDQAFDPGRNTAYAATYLDDLRASTRTWGRAVGRYHSATRKHSGRYRAKVFRAWTEARGRVADARRRVLAEKQRAGRAARAAQAADAARSLRTAAAKTGQTAGAGGPVRPSQIERRALFADIRTRRIDQRGRRHRRR